MHRIRVYLRSWLARARHLRLDAKGQISIIFALSSFMLVTGVGGAIDLTRAYQARQKLSEAATLACQYASRPSVVDTSTSSYSGQNGGATYTNAVNAFITSTLGALHFPFTQATATPFTYTQNGPANVNLTSSVPTSFMKIVRVTTIPIAANSHCYDNVASLMQRVPNGNSTLATNEGFENSSCVGRCYTYTSPSGAQGTVSTPVSTPSPTIAYSGSGGASWIIMGYCLEIDSAGVIETNVPEGTHSAELDCDNGSGNAGNSSISTQVYLPTGNYELRYNYVSRVDYPNYDPVYLCGSTASDLSWANDSNASDGGASNVSRTNQINVYFDLSTSNVPPTHLTMDNTQSLGGSNLVDMCVYAPSWIERSVRIEVSTPGYYWLSFAADGKNDSYGGQIDNIRLCQLTCTTGLADNFPPAWINQVLFEDTFDTPAYSGGPYAPLNYQGNAGVSYGTSPGWPTASATAWSAAPYNQIAYISAYAAQGTQSIQLDDTSTNGSTTNRLISRPFLLVPGYYKLSYYYVADITFSTLSSTPYCGATPTAARISSLSGTGAGSARAVNTPISTMALNTNIVAVFMAHSQLVSTPIYSATANNQTSYTNTNGTTSTTPNAPPDAISLTAYNASQSNPLLDICGYAQTWQARTSDFLIQKTGVYWLTFSSQSGTGDGFGGSLDDVKLTALGSPYMSSPPSTPVTIPVPAPQPDTTKSFTGFMIVADPLMPPAAPQ